MKHTLFLVLGLFASLCLSAKEINFQGDFRKSNHLGVPRGWYLNAWHGYKPAPTITYLPGEQGRRILHIDKVPGRSGFGLCHAARFQAAAGDILTVTAKVKGRGKGWMHLQVFRDRKWLGLLPTKNFQLTPDWQSVQFELPVADLSQLHPTNEAMLVFGASHDAEFSITDLKGTLREANEISGNIPLPVNWTMFLPVSKDFAPSPSELTAIPSSLNGVSPRPRMPDNGIFNLAEDFGGQKTGNCAWLFTEIQAAEAQRFSIGAGADWWMTIYLNGEKILDTSKNGNGLHPPRVTDHRVTAGLKKGRNILAVRFVTGKGSSVFTIAGPMELRSRGHRLRIAEVLSADCFDNENVKRPGSPEIIRGNPTPGLLSITGQAVYRTRTALQIDLPKNTFGMPDLSTGKYLGQGLRIQNFGPAGSPAADLKLQVQDADTGKAFQLLLKHDGSPHLKGSFLLENKKLKDFSFPETLLPADFVLATNADGSYYLSVFSLKNSSLQIHQGKCSSSLWTGRHLRHSLIFSPESRNQAVLTIDNYQIFQAVPEIMKNLIPLELEIAPSFDPVKAGWKLVFSDEFNGQKIDHSKWHCSGDALQNTTLKDGFMEIRASMLKKPRGSRIQTGGGLKSRQRFKYGYFEGRVRFTQCPGWWSNIYLYAPSVGNNNIDGMEIDVYEDYYMGGKTGRKGENSLDHNLHCYVGGILKSWNYLSKLPGSPDEFHTIGCKWTPFEISYYLDGKLIRSSANHSPHKSVTFDAVNHASCTVPLDFRIGCSIQGPSYSSYTTEHITEVFKADYVRIYAYPENQAPIAEWTADSSRSLVVKTGEKFILEARAKVNPVTRAPITGAYLVDSGCIIGFRKNPPYRFEISIDKNFYQGSNYVRSGRTGTKSDIGALHAYTIMFQDARKNAAHTSAILKYPLPLKQSAPYQGKAQTIPGTVRTSRYDEGGNGVAYCDDSQNVFTKTFRPGEGVDAMDGVIGHVLTGEWIRVTVDIQQAGRYRARLRYGTPQEGPNRLIMLLDKQEKGEFVMPPHKGWGLSTYTDWIPMEFPQGKHIITLIAVGAFNFGDIEFAKISEQGKTVNSK